MRHPVPCTYQISDKYVHQGPRYHMAFQTELQMSKKSNLNYLWVFCSWTVPSRILPGRPWASWSPTWSAGTTPVSCSPPPPSSSSPAATPRSHHSQWDHPAPPCNQGGTVWTHCTCPVSGFLDLGVKYLIWGHLKYACISCIKHSENYDAVNQSSLMLLTNLSKSADVKITRTPPQPR